MISALIEKVYNANYDIHVHLYKIIYQRLQKYSTMNYYDHTLFTNMEQFTSLDFEVFWYQVNSSQSHINQFDNDPKIEWRVTKIIEQDLLSIKKFISLGLLQQSNIKTSNSSNDNPVYGIISDIDISLEPTGFVMNDYMMSIYKEVDKFIVQETKEKLIEARKPNTELLDDSWGDQ